MAAIVEFCGEDEAKNVEYMRGTTIMIFDRSFLCRVASIDACEIVLYFFFL